jgi:hypothetical protein
MQNQVAVEIQKYNARKLRRKPTTAMNITVQSCKGCESKFIRQKPNQTFCGACLIYQYGHVCVKCHNMWQEVEGCDSTGKCFNCSTNKLVDFALQKFGPVSYSEECNNCGTSPTEKNEVLCASCLDNISEYKI